MFLEPCMFHFTKDEAFGLFTSEIGIGNSGVNMESAIYNGFECYNQELSWFVCLRHLKKVMKKKCLSCCRKKPIICTKILSKAEVLNDVYGQRTRTYYKYGLETDGFNAKLISVKEK